MLSKRNPMANKKEKTRLKAEEWYIEHTDCTQAQIAELFHVAPNTVGDWVRKHNWDDKRLEYHSSPVRIKQILQDEFIWVSQGNKARIDTDALSKINASLERVDRKADPYVYARMLKELDNFISQINPKFAADCTPFHKLFLQHRIDLEA
ncbi:hypothetical protein ACFS5N_16300 [Mucilaginibacter ximonensis]|uniref:ATPase subunit gpP of terminase n=2 Tax=Mucilaginibacter ximonensis TaxID=538021 RepID=A0ABW5YFH9_9SPHI